MGIDFSTVRSRLENENRSKLKKFKNTNTLNFMSHAQMEIGNYLMRVLPGHPTKNPKGVFYRATHWMEVSPAPNQKKVKFFCPKSYGDTQKCFICDEILPTYMENPEEFSEQFRDILNELIPMEENMLYIACKSKELSSKVLEGGAEKVKKTWVPNEMGEWIPAIFSIKADSILKDFMEQFNARPLLDDLNMGNNILFQKTSKNTYKLIVYESSPFEKPEFCEDKAYPSIAKFGEKDGKKDNSWITLTTSNTWWFNPMGFSL